MLTSRQPIWIGWGPSSSISTTTPTSPSSAASTPARSASPPGRVARDLDRHRAAAGTPRWAATRAPSSKRSCSSWSATATRRRPTTPSPTARCPDDDGGAGGIICANTDDTLRVIGERQLALLRELAGGDGRRAHVAGSMPAGAQSAGDQPRDLPFALLYFAEPDSEHVFAGRRVGHRARAIRRAAALSPRRTACGRSRRSFAASNRGRRDLRTVWRCICRAAPGIIGPVRPP